MGQIIRGRGWVAATVLAALLAVAGACGDDAAQPAATVVETVEVVREVPVEVEVERVVEVPKEVERIVEVTPTPLAVAELKGTIEVDGSSTVFPVTEAVAEEFRKVHPKVQVNVGVSGTGGGFKRFTAGDTDISNASREIRDSESAAAESEGIAYYELLVGIDGLSVMVNPRNDFVDCLTIEELKAIWEPGSTIDNWSQVRPGFPDQRMRLYGPGTDSGTFDYFTEEVVGEAQAARSDFVSSEDDNVLVVGINGDKDALGFFGYAYYQENPDKLKLVAVDAGNGCVTPTPATIESGEYTPLSRPLFIYVNAEAYERPEVAAFVDFYMENATELVAEVGYIRLSGLEYAVNLAALRTRTVTDYNSATGASGLAGTIEIDGSSTVFPVTEAVAEEFRKDNPQVQVNVGVSGTGGGFKRFTAGETEISNASRSIKESERAAAAENGVEFLELRVGIDGLSVMVNPSNDFVDCLTLGELKAIWEPGSNVENWSQVRPDFPDQRMRLYGPGTDSGTFDYFTEEVVGEAQAARSDFVASEDDNVLVVGINGDKDALGFFGYAYYQENPDKLKLVAVDAGDGCVTPTPATIESGEYQPLSRPLFIYVNKEALARQEVKAFVDFYMVNGAELVSEVGYVRLADAEYRANLILVQAAR